MPLSTLTCSAEPIAHQLAEPDEIPQKKQKKRRTSIKASSAKENANPKAAKVARKPTKKSDSNDKGEQVQEPLPTPSPPTTTTVLPSATVRRTDGAGRTELRKDASVDSAGNGVVVYVFDADSISLICAGDEWSYVQAGRKKGYMQTAYLLFE